MDFKLIQDTDMSLAELIDLVYYGLKRVDRDGIIKKSIEYHGLGFVTHFKRLMDVNQVMVAKGGMCSWVLVNEESLVEINKIRWTLPKNVSNGNILYITMCVLENHAGTFKVKRKFEELGMRNLAKEVRWYNHAKNHKFLNKLSKES